MDWGGGRFLSRLYSSAFARPETRLPEYKPGGTDLPLSRFACVSNCFASALDMRVLADARMG